MLTTFTKKRWALVVYTLLILGSINLNAQDGNPYLVNYNLPTYVSNQNWGFEQGDNGEIFVLNLKDIYSFDGLQWESLGVKGRPIAIAFSNYLFFCTEQGVGYFDTNTDGQPLQKSLIKVTNDNFYYKFSRIDDGLLVVSPTTICRISTSDSITVDTLYHDVRPEVFISDFFQIQDNTYHVKNGSLIYLNKPDGGYELLAGLPIGESFTFSFIHNNTAYFGSTHNKIHRFNGQTLSQYKFDNQAYANASILNGGASVGNNLIALSTLNGGCLIIDTEKGETTSTLNYLNGLPDDEVFSIGIDKNNGLWISHPMGLTRVDFSLPIKSMNYYRGLMGNALSCVEYKDKLYVGTGEGLFYLDKHLNYKPVDIYVKKTIPKEKEKLDTPAEIEQEISKKRKGFIAKLFSRSETEPSKEETVETKQNHLTENEGLQSFGFQQKRIYKLESVNYRYKKVEGLNAKVRFLVEANGQLYAATSFGLYSIRNNKASIAIPDLNIVFAQESEIEKGSLLLGTTRGALVYTQNGSIKPLVEQEGTVVSITQLDERTYILSNEFDVYTVSTKKGVEPAKITMPQNELGSPYVRRVQDEIMVFYKRGAYVLKDGILSKTERFPITEGSQYYHYQQGVLWQQTNHIWQFRANNNLTLNIDKQLLNLFENPTFLYATNASMLYVINSYTDIYRITSRLNDSIPEPLSLFVKHIIDKDGNILNPNSISLDYANNALKIKMSAPSFVRQGAVIYQYLVKGLTTSWTEWSNDPFIELPFIPSGNYTILIRAQDIIGNYSSIVELPFAVKPPFWKTLWFYIACGVLIILFLIMVIKLRERSLKRDKLTLELKVKQRTRTIEKQNQALELQNDQIFKQNDEITQSITYARKIQWAVMPSEDIIADLIGDYFIMFRPRDIVSGDFYWITQKEDLVVVVAADCTGHGVPGAFMSMMGVSFLNDIVNIEGVVQPDAILNNLRQKIKAAFEKTGRDTQRQDGMDVAICTIDKKNKELMYAGAYNPLYIIRQGSLIEYKANKMPVGSYPRDKEPFTMHRVEIKPNDRLYMFSDGYVSQFGGPDGRKFMTKRFKELLLKISAMPMAKQQTQLEDAMDMWQSSYDQVDDILVIGIEVK
ncbi:MAG: SpoIIE family protein phosphatase [Bacteroidales bacterium]